jgi:hypothetical protein
MNARRTRDNLAKTDDLTAALRQNARTANHVGAQAAFEHRDGAK